jgi:hypothetical protein
MRKGEGERGGADDTMGCASTKEVNAVVDGAFYVRRGFHFGNVVLLVRVGFELGANALLPTKEAQVPRCVVDFLLVMVADNCVLRVDKHSMLRKWARIECCPVSTQTRKATHTH